VQGRCLRRFKSLAPPIKKGYQELHKIIYPRAVVPIRVNMKPISQEIVSSITSFFLIYLFIFLISTLIVLAIEDLPIITAVSACAAAIGNVGPGLGEVGPSGNYADLSSFTKIVLSFLKRIYNNSLILNIEKNSTQ